MSKKTANSHGKQFENPFEKVTAEQLNDNYSLLAHLFARPEEAVYSKLRGRENYIVVGGWGSGKTMLLKFLGLQTQIEDLGVGGVRNAEHRFLHKAWTRLIQTVHKTGRGVQGWRGSSIR